MIICNNVYIGLTILYKAIIGDVIYLGYNVFILDYSHGNHNERVIYVYFLVFKRKLFSKDPIIIEKNIWIWRNNCILGNGTIGDNAIIDTRNIVIDDAEENSIYDGVSEKNKIER